MKAKKINRSYPILSILGLILAFLSQPLGALATELMVDERPNIVFILTDDHRYDGMGFMDVYPWLETPSLDRIAKEGAHFKNAFVTTSVCAPSRASFLTGLYAHKHGMASNQDTREPDWSKTPSFGQYLNEQGYRTGYIGKWHMYHHNRNRPGWEFWASFTDQGNYYGNDLLVNGEPVHEAGYVTDVLNRYALDFLKVDDDRPFLLYLSHKAVHAPMTPAKRHLNLYEGETLELTPNKTYNLEGKPEWQKANSPGFSVFRNQTLYKSQSKQLDGGPSPHHARSFFNNMRSLQAVDEGIGEIMDLLEEQGRLDNTLIIYAGDNGFLFGEHRRGDKRVAYEESIRIPFLMRWPLRIPAGRVVEESVLNVDLAPTLLDLVGVNEQRAAMDGRSMLPLFNSAVDDWRDGFLYAYHRDLQPIIPSTVAYRDGRYKIVTYVARQDDLSELYDLESDPYELKNLYYNPEYADLRERMTMKLEEEKARLDFTTLIPEPDVDRFPAPLYGTFFDYGATEQGQAHGSNFIKDTQIVYPRDPGVNFADEVYTLRISLRATEDGAIASQGDGVMGAISAITDGKFRFILLRGDDKHRPNRRYILESKEPILNRDCEVLVVYNDNLKHGKLYIDGKFQSSVELANTYGLGTLEMRRLTLGRTPGFFKAELSRIDLTGEAFTGELKELVISRVPATGDIPNVD